MKRINFISKVQLLEKMENKDDFVLVEVLDEDQYEKKHLPGAVNIPVNKIKERAKKEILDKEKEIVVYCADFNCHASTSAAEKLEEMEYKNVMDFAGGKKEWEKAELPMKS